MSEIKPCPFCGKAPMVCDEGVVCSDAYCIGRPEYNWFEIRDWQMRPIEDELRSRVEELERELEKYKNPKLELPESDESDEHAGEYYDWHDGEGCQ